MAKKYSKSIQHDDLDGIESVDRLAGWARKFIAGISACLGAFFAWIQIREIPFTEIVENTSPEFLTTTSLIIYYACWIGGTNFDVKIQQKVYVADPKGGKIAVETILVIVIFFAVTALLLWASKNVKMFAVLLAVFVIANIFGWRHIIARVKPAVSASRKIFSTRRYFFRLEQLNLVQKYMAGRWQIHRFWVMLGMVAIVNIICFFDSVREHFATFLIWIGLELSPNIIANLLPGFTILGFVLVAEIWIWIKRINVHTALSVIDELRRKYTLKLVAAQSSKSP